MEKNYYAENLNSQKLYQVYETSLPRIKRYLEAEIEFVRARLSGRERVLELGAGYGRIVKELAPFCASIVGMDISEENVALGRRYLKDFPHAGMVVMDVHDMRFDRQFDVVLCLQNGLSAMRADDRVIKDIIGLLAPGGAAYFSSYSAKFWDCRLKWFEEQASKGLLGAIDPERTKYGVIVCTDGFKATTHTPDDFERIGAASGYPYQVTEVDDSSVFLIIHKTS